MFIDEYEREDIVEYREKFLEEISLLLSYFVEFSKDDSILKKNYSDNCIVRKLDRKQITMITYNKSTFLVIDGR